MAEKSKNVLSAHAQNNIRISSNPQTGYADLN